MLFLFLLTPLREGRQKIPDKCKFCGMISTHAPAGGATYNDFCQEAIIIFLLTPLREGRRHCLRSHTPPSPFLLTPLREGRLGPHSFRKVYAVISTHAPAGGATICSYVHKSAATISTHAPAGGATSARVEFCCRGTNFYSRPCGRGDIR